MASCWIGAYIVYEAIIDDDRSENAFGLMMNLNMLIVKETRVKHLIGPDSMVIGIK